MELDSYVLSQEDLDWATLLSDWWTTRLPVELTVPLVNRFGEPILVFKDNSVHRLDLERSVVERLADSWEDFATRADVGTNADEWLRMSEIDRARRAGLLLDTGQCYGYAMPLVLGGQASLENTRVKSIREYYSFLADLHRQISDLPDGTNIQLNILDGTQPR